MLFHTGDERMGAYPMGSEARQGIPEDGNRRNGTTGGRPLNYKEKTNHGDALLPVRHYHCIVPDTYRNLCLHWHDEMEITKICGGAIRYDIGFDSVLAETDDLLLLSPGILHSAHEIPGKAMVSDSFVFHLDFLGHQTPDVCAIKFLNPIQSGNFCFTPVARRNTPGYGELRSCFDKLLRCFTEGKYGFELQTKELMLEFLRLMYEYGYVNAREGSKESFGAEEKLKGVLSYIRDHYREEISILELASLCHFSQTYFMNFFKRFAGATCVEYINHYRITKAAEALLETDRQVMEIALECGFRNISYFNKVFKRRFQMTPGSYRKHGLNRNG